MEGRLISELVGEDGHDNAPDHMDREAIVEELWAREQIRDCLYRYSRGVDRRDLDLVRSCYHPDATDAHGAYNGDLEGFLEFVRQSTGTDSPFGIMQHVITNVLIERTGPVAHVESYLYNPITPRDPSGNTPDVLIGGRFIDRFECRDGHWAIAERRLVFDYSSSRPTTPGVWELPDFQQLNPRPGDVLRGRPNRTDPLYDRV
ncbi:MAG: nuclear transport factor 2 family protein [Acidimicrobiales bacterium]